MQLFPYEGMEPPEIWLIMLGSVVVRTLKRRNNMKNITKHILGALLLMLGIIGFFFAYQLNSSLITGDITDLTIILHIIQIVSVALVIILNRSNVVDFMACGILLLSGVKPANSFVSKYFGKIEGIWGAVIPIVLLISITIVLVVLFYMVYKTNKLVLNKGLIAIISSLCLLASIIIGFAINAIAAQNGVKEIGLITEGLLMIGTTILLIVSFFLTKENWAKVAIVPAGFLAWWPFINEKVVSHLITQTLKVGSVSVKGVLPIVIGILAFVVGKHGIQFLRTTTFPETDADEPVTTSPEDDTE